MNLFKGDPDNLMYRAGKLYNDGKYEQALKLYKKAAEAGSYEANEKIGQCYYWGEGTEINKPEAAKWLKSAADDGYMHSMYMYSYMLLNGDGVEYDGDKALYYAEKAVQWAEHSVWRQDPPTYRKRLETVRKTLEAKKTESSLSGESPEDLFAMSERFKRGSDQYDLKRQMEWLRKAWAAGSTEAGLKIADFNLDGFSEYYDRDAGVKLLKEIADKNSAEAAERLYDFYRGSDPEEASKWLERAVELGSAKASFELAQRLERGE